MTQEYDYVIRAETEDAAKLDPVLSKYWITDGPCWRGDICTPHLDCYVYGPQPDDLEQPRPKISFSGWYLRITLDVIDPALRDLPNNACRTILDRTATSVTGQNVLVYVASDLDLALLSEAHVDPVPAGSEYVQG